MDIILSVKRKKKGKKDRKHGRAARKPSHNKYNLERQWEQNKKRKIEKEKRRQEKLKKFKIKRSDPTPKLDEAIEVEEMAGD